MRENVCKRDKARERSTTQYMYMKVPKCSEVCTDVLTCAPSVIDIALGDAAPGVCSSAYPSARSSTALFFERSVSVVNSAFNIVP